MNNKGIQRQEVKQNTFATGKTHHNPQQITCRVLLNKNYSLVTLRLKEKIGILYVSLTVSKFDYKCMYWYHDLTQYLTRKNG